MARPLLPDDLWDQIAPLLPPPRPRPKGGRRPIGDQAALTGILFVVRSVLPWEMLPAEMGCGSGMSCWWRLRDWQAAGVWGRLHHVLLERLHAAGEIDWSRACLDSASVPSTKGVYHRPEPDGPGQAGHEAPPRHRRAWHPTRLLSERGQPARQRDDGGHPRCHPASAERSARATATPSGQAARRQSLRWQTSSARMPGAGIVPRIARKGIESSEKLGRHRWVVV